MAKKYPTKQITAAEYQAGVMTPNQIRDLRKPLATGPKTCESCGHFHDEETSDSGPCGECRLNPPYLADDHLTRRGPIRRYPVVLSNTPACSYHRPRAA